MDRDPDFDGVRIGRPAVGGLSDAGFVRLADLPDDLDELRAIHGVGPKAIRLLGEARASAPDSERRADASARRPSGPR